MLAIVLALASALAYGVSDYTAGLASRDFSVIQVTLVSAAASTLVVAAALPFAAGHPPGAASLAWGALAGLGEEVGALALYYGFRHAAFSVAGALSAVGAAGFAVVAGLLFGERPSALALTGIILALPAIVGVSASAAAAGGREEKGEGGQARGRFTGVVAGLVAGACFSLLFIGLNRAGSHSGLWPVASASGAELAMAVVVAAATRNFRRPVAHQGLARGVHRGHRRGGHRRVLLRHARRVPGRDGGPHLAVPGDHHRARAGATRREADHAAAGRARPGGGVRRADRGGRSRLAAGGAG